MWFFFILVRNRLRHFHEPLQHVYINVYNCFHRCLILELKRERKIIKKGKYRSVGQRAIQCFSFTNNHVYKLVRIRKLYLSFFMWFQIEPGFAQLQAAHPNIQEASFMKVIKSAALPNEQKAFRILIHSAHLHE